MNDLGLHSATRHPKAWNLPALSVTERKPKHARTNAPSEA